MNEFIKANGIFLSFAIIGLASFILMGVLHEQVHVQIYESYGIESRMELFKHFPHFMTVADKPCPTPECTLAHNINEVVGYTANGFFIMIYFGFLFVLIKREKDGRRNS